MKKRLFISIPITEELRDVFFDLKEKYASQEIRWTVPGNLHITVYFIGYVDEGLLPEIIEKLGSLFSAFFASSSQSTETLDKKPSPGKDVSSIFSSPLSPYIPVADAEINTSGFLFKSAMAEIRFLVLEILLSYIAFFAFFVPSSKNVPSRQVNNGITAFKWFSGHLVNKINLKKIHPANHWGSYIKNNNLIPFL